MKNKKKQYSKSMAKIILDEENKSKTKNKKKQYLQSMDKIISFSGFFIKFFF